MSDILLFGATGVVGRLTARHLAGHDVILAGRDVEKLRELRDEINPAWEIATGDAHSADDMAALAARAAVVISCVGPYSRLGWEMVNACAIAGTDYVDLCGEVPFIRRVIDTHHGTTSARIVHSCGFDSVPSDMGAFALREHAGEPLDTVTMVVEKLRGGLSTGTLESMREVSAQAHADRAVARNLHHPYSLSPVPSAEPRLEDAKDITVTKLADGRWTGPFFMAMFNTRVVRRSNSLRGERFTYHERWATRTRLGAWALTGATAALFAASQKPALRRLVPTPGNGYFRFTHEGVTESGRQVSCTVAADGDPGYVVTAMMLGEAALTLLDNPGEGGVLTPSTALGAPYLERLRAGGMSFTCG